MVLKNRLVPTSKEVNMEDTVTAFNIFLSIIAFLLAWRSVFMGQSLK